MPLIMLLRIRTCRRAEAARARQPRRRRRQQGRDRPGGRRDAAHHLPQPAGDTTCRHGNVCVRVCGHRSMCSALIFFSSPSCRAIVVVRGRSFGARRSSAHARSAHHPARSAHHPARSAHHAAGSAHFPHHARHHLEEARDLLLCELSVAVEVHLLERGGRIRLLGASGCTATHPTHQRRHRLVLRHRQLAVLVLVEHREQHLADVGHIRHATGHPRHSTSGLLLFLFGVLLLVFCDRVLFQRELPKRVLVGVLWVFNVEVIQNFLELARRAHPHGLAVVIGVSRREEQHDRRAHDHRVQSRDLARACALAARLRSHTLRPRRRRDGPKRKATADGYHSKKSKKQYYTPNVDVKGTKCGEPGRPARLADAATPTWSEGDRRDVRARSRPSTPPTRQQQRPPPAAPAALAAELRRSRQPAQHHHLSSPSRRPAAPVR